MNDICPYWAVETRNYDQLDTTTPWFWEKLHLTVGEGEYYRGWGLGIKCLIEWNEIIDLLSNEGFNVKICEMS